MRKLCQCGHPDATHVGPDGPCRMNKCRCELFNEVGAAGRPEQPSRMVTFEIPDGYVLNVQLVPVDGS